MKLKSGFVTYNTDGEQIMVSADGTFNGLTRSNKTAAFIIDCLKEETSEEAIVNKMIENYNAPKEIIENDVHNIIETLKKIKAIEE